MKILHVCLIGPFSDNWTYQENFLSKYHKKMGHDVSLVASTYSWDNHGKYKKLKVGEYINEDGVRVYRLENKWNTTIDSKLKMYVGLLDVLNEVSPDLLFVHDVQFLDVYTLVKYLKRNPHVKVYVDNHADFLNSARTWLSKNILHKILWKKCAHKILPYTTKFYGVLPSRVDFLVDLYNLPREKCELLVMGGDDELIEKVSNPEISNITRQKNNFSDSDIVIVTGGKVDKSKTQILLLMKAINGIVNSNIKLVVFGSVIAELKEDFEKELSERVKYVGWKSAEEIYFEFAAADIIAFPGLHSVLWEQAVALGKPCVFKKIEGYSHIDFGGNCEYFTEETVESYQAIVMYVNNHLSEMKTIAESKLKDEFLYGNISKKSIER